MASPHSPEPPRSPTRTIDDLLTCPVCLESFRDPKTLACLHTFCSNCLENCRRPYRREITCPVCKKITSLPPMGIQGLQNDFRIQQIKDILQKQHVSPVKHSEDSPPVTTTSANAGPKDCDLCKAQKRCSPSSHHCVQCCMFYCPSCNDKHKANALFSSHHVIDMCSGNATEVMFCKLHPEHAVRYFCRSCSCMLCTICTMDHNPQHMPVTLDKGVIDQYHSNLQDLLISVNSKHAEVKSHAKYLGTLKQTYKRALYEAQKTIHARASEAITEIQNEEKALITKAQDELESRMRTLGLDNLGDINFHLANIESLQTEVHDVMKGSPQNCLMVYDDVVTRMTAVADTPMPSIQSCKSSTIVKFVPKEEPLNVALGVIQECTLSEDSFSEDQCSSPGSPPTSPYGGPSFTSLSRRKKSSGGPKRVSSILSALACKKGEVKIGKVKAFSAQAEKVKNNAINADDLLGAGGSNSQEMRDVEEPQPSCSSPSSGACADTPPSSPNRDEAARYRRDQQVSLVFKIDQVGGWPGKIMTPSSVDFLPDGSIVVAECDNRLQVFDRNGQSMRIIGWGKIKPQGVAVTLDGRIAITDKKDKCVKIFTVDGECRSIWGSGMFSYPAGIAAMPSGNFVVADVDRHMVSIHSPDGGLLTQFGCWGSGDYQFNSPTYIAVTKDEHIIVSDSCNGFIKVFDKTGTFVRKFSSSSGHVLQDHLRRPQGLCADSQGNILLADRENHRISMFTLEGQFVRHLVSRLNGIKYPCDVRANAAGQLVVVESHSGFLTKEPHHAVKLFQV